MMTELSILLNYFKIIEQFFLKGVVDWFFF